ncbi:MAG: transporter substrate-binding domain-containing protein [Bacteroidales bacterium]|nr:transporter substrate-binding domain-containing protein [Bacteroidales bacterium]
MKTKLFILVSVIMLLFVKCKKDKPDDSYPYQFRFLTEQYKPLNYVENGNLTGLGPEILKSICNRYNIPFEVNVLPWEEAYNLALQHDNAVLFSAVLNSTRKDLFKWAGPITSLDWFFYSSAQNQIQLNSLEDAKQVNRIGVIKDHSITQYLIEEGFTNLVYIQNNIDAFDQLLNGDIDLVPSDRIAAEAALKEIAMSYYLVNAELKILTDMLYFAFNKNVPDYVIADFQKEIDRMKSDGRLESLHEEFMDTPNFPGTLQIYTEHYPPLTFMDSYGDITGFGSDIVFEIMKRNKEFFDITLSQWNIGYEMALTNPNFSLFTMDRTEIRDTLFQWVGPLGTNTTYFFTKAGSGIVINSIDDAKNLSAVGTVSSWYSDQYLQQLGFTNLVSDGDPLVVTEMLMNGDVDAFVCSEITFPDLLEGLGYQYSQVVPEFALMASDYYIAFSKNTSSSIVSQWQEKLDEIKLDGTYDAIYHKWLQ